MEKLSQNPSDPQEVVKQFNTYLKYKEDVKRKKQVQKSRLILAATIFYTLIAGIITSGLMSKEGFIYGLFSERRNSEEQRKMEYLESEIVKINDSVDRLDKLFEENSKNTDLAVISTRLGSVEEKQSNIEQTILMDPDKAITTRLLRDKQEVLNNELTETKNALIRLNDKLDNFIIGVFATPLLVGLIGWGLKYIFTRNRSEATD